MRIDAAVTAVSWIPSEALPGPIRIPMDLGIGHYDAPPPETLGDLAAMHAASQFRFANALRAWIEVDTDGRIAAAEHSGDGLVSATVVRLGRRSLAIPPVVFPTLQRPPEIGPDRARFVQTVGGRTGAPMPRTVKRAPYVQVTSPIVWTTLALTIHVDGTIEHEVVGASPFPRHWIYDDSGALVAKSGHADYRKWAGENFGDRAPWRDHDQRAIVAEAASALERSLSAMLMQGGARPTIRRLRPGATLTRQGDAGDELYLIRDGMLDVTVDGEQVAEIGPGAIVGERAVLEGGRRTATLTASTPCRVAVATSEQLAHDALRELSLGHRHEEVPAPSAAQEG